MTAQAPMSLFDGSALARATRSFLRRLVDPIIESRQRKAEEFLAEYIRTHQECIRTHRDSLPAQRRRTVAGGRGASACWW